LNDGYNLFDFIGSQFSGTLVDIDFGLLDQVRETTSDTRILVNPKTTLRFPQRWYWEYANVLEFRSLHQGGGPVEREKNK
jgi:hypothetical protein